MAIKDVSSKCWILALFVRDDGERLLLGDGSYEFNEKQLHFVANTMANDVVEVQGNDGYMLAGQVRRPSTQTFDGYVGDSSTSKAVVEERRRAFFAFFRKDFFYKVIYVFPDGSAIQRKRGFLVDAPEVKEIRQIYPEYHVALNFEDINYYYYDEDADGEEIYGKSATISLNSVAQSGGLIWVLPSEVTLTGEGTSFTLSGTTNGTALTSAELKGNTYQQTYSGKNLFNKDSTNIISGKYLTSSGAETWYDGYNITDYMPISPNTAYTLSASSGDFGGGPSRCYYDQNKTFISGVQHNWAAPFTNTSPAGAVYMRETFKTSNTNVQVEEGSATSYEPYVGGIPSPNPDYPQEVQTATGRQVVTVSNGSQSQEYELNLGKNLFDKDNANVFSGYVSGGVIVSNAYNRILFIQCDGGTEYTIQKTKAHRFEVFYTKETPAIGTQIYSSVNGPIGDIDGTSVSLTYTTGAEAKFLCVIFRQTTQDTTITEEQMLATVQIEKGSTATSYAPYFEPIELCKIGNYQDRIYKSGDDWYLHKAINKEILDGSETWTYGGPNNDYMWKSPTSNAMLPPSNLDLPSIMSPYWSAVVFEDIYYSTSRGISLPSNSQRVSISTMTNMDTTKTWLANNKPSVYYVLNTPTDTQITNTALIAQLDALAAATTYNGSTGFTVDGNGNLAAILAVEVESSGGGGVEWDEDGAVWEEGKPSYSIISVDSIDNVYPVLTITGRTVNPVLTDVTTGTIFQYNGTITASQVLKVDMMNKTATLNGVSVIGNVTGDWLYLAPGNNRITYTADNADAPNATVEWQEIVG